MSHREMRLQSAFESKCGTSTARNFVEQIPTSHLEHIPNLTPKPLKPNLAAQAPPPAVRSYSNCTDVYHELPEAVTQQNQKGVTFPNTVEQTQAAVAITGGERAHGIFNAAPRCPRRHNGILEVRSWTAAQYNCGDHLFTLERCEMASAGRGCYAEERTPAHSPHTDS